MAKNDTSLGYDMIAGIDFLTALGVQLYCQNHTIMWDNITMDMHAGIPTNQFESQKLFLVKEPTSAHQATKRIVRITDMQYEPGNVDTLCKTRPT